MQAASYQAVQAVEDTRLMHFDLPAPNEVTCARHNWEACSDLPRCQLPHAGLGSMGSVLPSPCERQIRCAPHSLFYTVHLHIMRIVYHRMSGLRPAPEFLFAVTPPGPHAP